MNSTTVKEQLIKDIAQLVIQKHLLPYQNPPHPDLLSMTHILVYECLRDEDLNNPGMDRDITVDILSSYLLGALKHATTVEQAIFYFKLEILNRRVARLSGHAFSLEHELQTVTSPLPGIFFVQSMRLCF